MTLFIRLKQQLKKVLRYIGLAAWAVIEYPVGLIFEKVPLETVAFWIKDHLRWLWDSVLGSAWIQRTLSKAVFRKFGNVTPPRPHQATMACDYTSWYGMVDRKYSGRHLPADKRFDDRTRPEQDRLVNLFLRPNDGTQGGAMTVDMRSTLLFASMAQWFTDSFLRTSHAFDFDPKTGDVIEDENGIPMRLKDREKFNDSTHEIDLCQIYGLSANMTEKLRSPDDKGCLRSQMINEEEYPEFLLSRAPTDKDKSLPIKKHFDGLHDEKVLRRIFKRIKEDERYETLFATGLEHSNATLGNALLNVVFLRLHNKIAREIAASEPDWDDDRVFETTRNTMIVVFLQIVISDYIRHISPLNLPLSFQKGVAENQNWYRSNRIHIEFNILYRWHGLVPSRFSFLPDPEDSSDFRHNNDWLIDTGIANAITHFSKERAGKMVIGNTPRFLAPVKQDTVSLMRAAKLQPYNAYRERFGLKAAKQFSDITSNKDLADQLHALYDGKIEDVEWYIGMCAESHKRGMLMGDLMFNMVAHDAFTHALTNPLLSNAAFHEETFGAVGWGYVQNVSTLKEVVENVVSGQSVMCEFAYNGEHTDRADI